MKYLSLVLICTGILFTSGCATRKFIINSNPEGAYIVGYGEATNEQPINESAIFLGKSDQYSFVAMKRGYYPDTLTVSKDSPLEVHFQLRRMEGVPLLLRRPMELTCDNANLLPVNVEIVLHKGVGNLDRYEKSEELSDKARSDLNSELQTIRSDTTVYALNIPENPDWPSVMAELEEYLQSLSPDLLAYYPEPPSVADILERNRALFSPVMDQLAQSGEEEFLVYGWCKSVKPTAGRIIGNVSASVASGVVSGYETAAYGYPVTYSDPSAFALDNSTLFVAYIIDPGSGEVLEARQYVVPYDITKMDRLQMLARSIILFPLAEQKQ